MSTSIPHPLPPSLEGEGGRSGTLLITFGTPDDASLAANIDRLIPILMAIRPPVQLITYCDPALIQTLDRVEIVQVPEHRRVLVKFLTRQIDVSRALIRCQRSRRQKTVFFAFGSDLSVVPVLLGRLLGCQVAMRSDGRPTTLLSRYFPGSSRIKLLVFRAIEGISYGSTHLLMTEADYMIADNDFEQYRPRVAPLPVALERFGNAEEFASRQFDIVIAGRHIEQKGFDELIDALPRLHHSHPSLKTLIVGDGPLRPAMEERVRAEGLQDRILLPGWVPRDELPQCLMNARMLLLPSRYEGLPNIVMEAMVSGTLVIATAVGGIPGIVRDGETGFLLPACSSDAICAGVERALADPRAAGIADHARAMVSRSYSFTGVLSRYVELFDELDRRAPV